MKLKENKMQVGMAEFLEKVGRLRKTQQKVDALKFNDSLPLRIILKAAFDPTVEWALPEGQPPYKENELVDQEHVLLNQINKLQYFIKGYSDNLQPTKREQLFIEMLENVDPKDAKLLCAIKEKKLPFPGITIQHVTEALPGLIADEKEQVL